jgi:ADP-L-glycero-D-manno-heptose 6-epimerase
VIIVTGGAGFIGSNIVADLNELGITDIVIVDWLGSDAKWRNLAKRRFSDIVFPEELDGFLESTRNVDAVIHMGAISSTAASDADEIIRSNFRLSSRLWSWCTRIRCPFIYASSAATYGDGANGFSDDLRPSQMDALRPLNLYGWSKHAFDKWALERVRDGLAPPQWVGLKFFNVYGPNESHKGDMQSLVAKSTQTVVDGRPVPLFKSYREGFLDGEQLRDFVYVKDCTSVIRWLLEKRDVRGLFNLGTGKARSFVDLISAIGSAIHKQAEVEFIEMPEIIRPNYQYFTQADMSKLISAGYDKSFCSLEDGVADYVRNYLTMPDIYR